MNLFGTKSKVMQLKKVGQEKWCLFLDFACFSGRHFPYNKQFDLKYLNKGRESNK